MNKYLVAVTYELVIFADDENQAAIIAQDGCLSSSVAHPQTGDVVHASIHIENAPNTACTGLATPSTQLAGSAQTANQ